MKYRILAALALTTDATPNIAGAPIASNLEYVKPIEGNWLYATSADGSEATFDNQSAVKDAFSGNMFTDLAKRNMAMFEDAAQAFSGKPKSEAKPTSSDVEQLKAELAALQAKVDRLSR